MITRPAAASFASANHVPFAAGKAALFLLGSLGLIALGGCGADSGAFDNPAVSATSGDAGGGSTSSASGASGSVSTSSSSSTSSGSSSSSSSNTSSSDTAAGSSTGSGANKGSALLTPSYGEVLVAQTGLSARESVTVVLNGTYSLTLSSLNTMGASFTDPSTHADVLVPFGSTYSVAIAVQPLEQTCTITSGGSGTAVIINVTSLSCVNSSVAHEAIRTAIGAAPAARSGASQVTDATGGIWLFGGLDPTAATNAGLLSDLWHYDPRSGAWSLVTFDVTAAGGPTARELAALWADAQGHLWVFGGVSAGVAGLSSTADLWCFTTATGTWTKVTVAEAPGARASAITWLDGAGDLELSGGVSIAQGASTSLHDAWRYSPASRQWSLVGQAVEGR